MRTILAMAVMTALALPAEAQDLPPFEPLPEFQTFGTPASDADVAAITALMTRFASAWGSEDVNQLVAQFAEDAEWTNAYGVVVRGHTELRRFFGGLFERFDAAIAAEESSRSERLSLRYVGTDSAVIHSVTESSRTDSRDGEGPRRRVHSTFVLAKQRGTWRIVHQMIMDARR